MTRICDTPHKGGKVVITAGTGRTKEDKTASERVIRYAPLLTIPSSIQSFFKYNPSTIICALKNPLTGQAASHGDSGKFLRIHVLNLIMSQNDEKLNDQLCL